MQIDCLLPASKVSFTKFGERYCLTQNSFPRGQSFYSNKYDGAAHHLCIVFYCSLLHIPQLHNYTSQGKHYLLHARACMAQGTWSGIFYFSLHMMHQALWESMTIR
jgi:hypothetical protein